MPDPLSVLFVDHLDSFSYNLVEAFERRDARVRVFRATLGAERLLAEATALPAPALVVLSPGPGRPGDVPATLELIRRLPDGIPLFGVCLGMQAMVEAYGGRTGRAPERLHGQASSIEHDGRGAFRGLPNPMVVGRYHSLCATEVPSDLEIVATDGRLPMAVRHRSLPRLGVQFHPESILTTHGETLLERVLERARRARPAHADARSPE